ncbi:hypothetical protein DENIS_3964 [Desulfonema ishimotonii]|uniref:Flagellar assembly protein T N-terminal domain-containing protein n=1 Tax=Desulfonema ishimotonii TaxID=45657 RepID=A0A401G164_9BACT|nr:hypothetical protein [Desulfonema ishimotonii]GBC62978.1 hypothetical protein DENIS_3964 [Desulfonema ishimotonii]
MPEYSRSMWRSGLGIICIVWALMVCPLLSAQEGPVPEPDSVTIIGISPVYKNNMANARSAAIKAGLDRGVEQMALMRMPAEGLARNFKPFLRALEGHTDDFVENYKVLAEAALGKEYRVMLQIRVSSGRLKQRLAGFTAPAVAELTGKAATVPKVLFLIAEQNLKDISPAYWWRNNPGPADAFAEVALADKVKASGLNIVAHGHTVPKVDIEAAIIFQPDLDNREALDIGRSMAADIVIVGKAIVYKVPDTAEDEVPSFSGTVTARAIRTDTGQEVAAVLESVVKKNADDVQGGKEALREAGVLAGQRLVTSLGAVRQDLGKARGERVELVVTGTRNLGNFVQFRRALSNTPGVEDIQIRETGPDEAVFQVAFRDGGEALGAALKSNVFELFYINVTEASGKRLRLALIAK